MKHNFKILICIILCYQAVHAATSDLNENSAVFNNGFVGQKQISDSKFKKTVEQLKERSLTKKQKRIREQVKSHSPLADEEHLKNFVNSQSPDDELSQTLTVMIPVKAYSDDGKYIQPGYYKLSCRKIAENKYVLDLSQGSERMISVEAKQTKQDLEQDTIQFCSAKIISDGVIRLMYGTIDLNLAAYIYYD